MKDELIEWSEQEKLIGSKVCTYYLHEREVWWCALGLNIGTEMNGSGKDFKRPVLIIRVFNRDSILIVPLTRQIKENIYTYKFIHKGNTYAALISQIRFISSKRLLRKMYKMDPKIFTPILDLICNIIKNDSTPALAGVSEDKSPL